MNMHFAMSALCSRQIPGHQHSIEYQAQDVSEIRNELNQIRLFQNESSLVEYYSIDNSNNLMNKCTELTPRPPNIPTDGTWAKPQQDQEQLLPNVRRTFTTDSALWAPWEPWEYELMDTFDGAVRAFLTSSAALSSLLAILLFFILLAPKTVAALGCGGPFRGALFGGTSFFCGRGGGRWMNGTRLLA